MPKLSKFFDRDIEPAAICRNCEYFDGGGLGQDGVPINFEGDCLQSMSHRYTTTQDDTCRSFWPCSTRWPDCDHD